MRIAVIGAGAIGMLVGARLQLSGHDVTWYVRRSQQFELLQRNGFQLDNQLIYPVQIEICSELNRTIDVVIWTIKQTQLNDDILMWAAERFGQAPYWISFQNGIGHQRFYSKWVSFEKMVYAVTTEAAYKMSDQLVQHTGIGQTWFGTYGETSVSQWLQEWVTSWVESGFVGHAVRTIEPMILKKWIVNCVVNPLTAIYRVRNGQLMEREELRTKAKELFLEIVLVLGESSFQQQVQMTSEELWAWIQEVCVRTASNHSSMLQDVLNEKPIEWQALNGELIRMATEKKIVLPLHNWLKEQLQ